MIDTFGWVAATASATVSKTGTPATFSPSLPGVTPATTFVPYSTICSVWNEPSRPVMPWTSRRVDESTSMLTVISFDGGRPHGVAPTGISGDHAGIASVDSTPLSQSWGRGWGRGLVALRLERP